VGRLPEFIKFHGVARRVLGKIRGALTLRNTHRLSRHRHTTALLVLTLVLGVLAPDASAGAIHHREHRGEARVRVTAQSIAPLARRAKRSAAPAARPVNFQIIWRDRPVSAGSPVLGARAGPAGRVVLRR